MLSIRGELAVTPFSSPFNGRKWIPRDKEIIVYEKLFKKIYFLQKKILEVFGFFYLSHFKIELETE